MRLTKDHLIRQAALIPEETLGVPVHIIGAGAIGSFTALSLAKMGMRDISVYDFDTVGIENMNSQLYRFKDIDKNKVTALADIVRDFTGTEIKANNIWFTPNLAPRLTGIVVFAVDSMSARRDIYEGIKTSGFAVQYIIDARMSAEFYMQYTINPFLDADKTTYEKTLYKDADAVQETCTAKATVYTAGLAAGMVCKTVKDLVTKANQYPRSTQWNIKGCEHPMVMFPNAI